MNKYIVELVKEQVSKTDDFAWVKYYEKPNSYLIYNIENHDPYLILFEDYCFCIYESCADGIAFKNDYQDLWEAIVWVRDNNK